jgi:MFS family permease
MQKVAQSWLVYELTGSAALLGTDAFLGEIPIMLFSMYGGVIVDRMDRRVILIGSQIVQMSCALVLSLLLFTNALTGMSLIYAMFALSFIAGTGQAFGGPAYQALIPSLVGKEQMPNAIAMNSIQFNIARIIGPIIGGIALQQFGGKWCFLLNSLSFLPVIFSLYLARPSFTPKPSTEGVWDSLKAAFSFIQAKPGLKALIGLAFTMTFFGIPITTFLPVIAKGVFKADSSLFTTMLTTSGIGAVAGGLLVASISKKRSKGTWALAMLGLLGAIISGFGLSSIVWISLTMLFLAGASLIAAFALVASLVQEVVPHELRGRVMSIYNMAFRGGMPLGNLATGDLIQVFGSAQTILAIEGLVLVAAAAYFYWRQPEIRKI